MRLKITKPLAGSIDGLHLGRFAVGEMYDVGTSLANYLLAMGAAEPVVDEETPGQLPMPQDELLNELRRRLKGGKTSGAAKAADRRHRLRKRR